MQVMPPLITSLMFWTYCMNPALSALSVVLWLGTDTDSQLTVVSDLPIQDDVSSRVVFC